MSFDYSSFKTRISFPGANFIDAVLFPWFSVYIICLYCTNFYISLNIHQVLDILMTSILPIFFILCQVFATCQYLPPSQYCHNDIIINVCVLSYCCTFCNFLSHIRNIYSSFQIFPCSTKPVLYCIMYKL